MILTDEEVKTACSGCHLVHNCTYCATDILLKAQLKKVVDIIRIVNYGIGKGSGRVTKGDLQSLLDEVKGA